MINVILEKPKEHITTKELIAFQEYLFHQIAQALKGVMTEYEDKQKDLGFGR